MPTTTQIERWYRKLIERATSGMGYQAFGYDLRTLEIIRPGFTAAHNRLRSMWTTADAAENP